MSECNSLGVLRQRRPAHTADELARSHPEITVVPDQIYVHDGAWTSVGVTAGIDLALQLVRTHHGSEMAVEAARNMVVYMQRAGGQCQFSTHLAPRLAGEHERAQRLFTHEVGISPGTYVERARIDAARALLEHCEDGLAAIAARCGFTSPETFLRSFKRVVGVNPAEYRQRFPTHG